MIFIMDLVTVLYRERVEEMSQYLFINPTSRRLFGVGGENRDDFAVNWCHYSFFFPPLPRSSCRAVPEQIVLSCERLCQMIL